jgi:glycosyltransferase involved in cell wall biosynthesis
MKLLYITTTNLTIDSGTTKKIFGQIGVMQEFGFHVDFIYPSNQDIVCNKQIIQSKTYSQNFNYFQIRKYLYESARYLIGENKINALYIRYSIFDWNFYKFIQTTKKYGCKIFLEIPSYPYDLQYKKKKIIKKPALIIDKLFRKKTNKFIDAIFTPTEGADFRPSELNGIHKIYNVPAYKFNNGINPNNLTPRKGHQRIKEKLRLIAVASHAFWHGYDRVLRGISEYYKTQKNYEIVFNIVGKGPELHNLRKLTKQLGITDNVLFHGFKTGDDLDELYSKSDLGVDAIGFHRSGLTKNSSLKAREYCLKSLPFIIVRNIDNDFVNFKYVINVPADDSPLDFSYIIARFEEICEFDYLQEMREYGESKLNWEHQFKHVIEVMKKP